MAPNTLDLKEGQRVRTAGITYEVQRDTSLPADFVPVTPQTTRQLKCSCDKCGYVARVSQKWLTLSGPPICPACQIRLTQEVKAEKPAKRERTTIELMLHPLVPPVPPAPPEAEAVTVLQDELNEYLSEPEPVEPPGDSPLAALLADL